MSCTYEARPAGCRPTDENRHWGGTFSVPIGEVVPEGTRKSAAIYRVRGNVEHENQVDALAARAVNRLNAPEDTLASLRGSLRGLRHPDADRSARIELTKVGKKAGFLR